MTLTDLQQEIQILSNAEIATHSQRFFKTGKGQYGEGDVFLGIRVPVLRKFAIKYKHLELTQIETLLHSRYHEERLLAAIMLVNMFKKADDKLQRQIYTLYLKNTAYINSWDIVDVSAPVIVGGYLWKKDKRSLYKLAKSKSLWEKRISIMATLYFIRQNDFEDTLKLAEMFISENHDLLQKASGWMLREIGNKDRKIEEMFLNQHYQQMPRTMLRYAIEKFPEKLRRKYLNGDV